MGKDISYIQRDLRDVRDDIKDLRGDMKDIRQDMRTDFRVLFGALIAGIIGLCGVMASGFGWLKF
ncbi:hypothetical protein BA188_15620 [Aeromonas hydrophila]|nr:hypothetical protein OI72_05520 [Aeromonas hydrophila]OFC44886.1 hypothetical protein BA189_17375 [Aeromonas hydrophila]OFC51647.1 hypothetical protein BA188_15620 [Aeromonas hydrophila]